VGLELRTPRPGFCVPHPVSVFEGGGRRENGSHHLCGCRVTVCGVCVMRD
jgi:hypothetical protein